MSKTSRMASLPIRKSFAAIGMSLILLITASPLSAQQVSKQQAFEKAMAFLGNTGNQTAAQRRTPRKAPVLQLASSGDKIFIFNDEANGGYVIMSGDARMPEVLGYSYTGHIDPAHIPCNLQMILDDCTRKVTELRANPLAGKLETRKRVQQAAVEPLLGNTAWDQGWPYNKMCPEVDGNLCLTGCTATATAQIMYYHKWPEKGQGNHSYEWHGQTLSADFSKSTYKWSKMLPAYEWDSNEESVDAVALLMRDVGYSCDMDYGVASSGATGQDRALITYFDYDASMGLLWRDNCDEESWNNIIVDELSHARPLFYSGGSRSGAHAMVIDGIDSNGYYHFNFGLSGDPDGYFSMQTVFFNSSPSINFRIMKDEGGSPHPVFCCPDDFEYGGYYVGSPGLTTTSVFPIETYLAALAVENTSNHNIKYMDEGENKNYFLVDQQLADGDYILYPVGRMNTGEEWQKFLFFDHRQNHVDLNVKDGVYTYTNNKPDYTQEGAVEVNGIYYFLDDDSRTAIVTYKNDRYDYYNGDITIPEKITYKKKTYTVTEIGEHGLGGARMGTLKLPKTIKVLNSSSLSCFVDRIVFDKDSELKTIMGFTFNYGMIHSMGLDLPEGVEDIYTCAFQSTDIARISLPSTITLLFGSVFNFSTKLRTVMVNWSTPLPMSNSPFNGFDLSLCTLYVPKGTAAKYSQANIWKEFGHIVEKSDTATINGLKYVLCDTDGSATLLTVPDLKQKTVVIPRSVSHQGRTYTVKSTSPYAFVVSDLEDLTIPSSVTYVGEGAFYSFYGTQLTSLRFHGKTPPRVPDTTEQGKAGFNPIIDEQGYDMVTLYVPSGCKARYKSDSFWGKFANIVEDASLGVKGIPGDANNDGLVNMTDITAIINYILNKDPGPFVIENVDVNGDNFINMNDVTAVINTILGR